MNDFDLAVENLYFGPMIMAFGADCDESVGGLAPRVARGGLALTSTAGVGEPPKRQDFSGVIHRVASVGRRYN